MLFFNVESNWSSWFIREILEVNIDKFWVINTKNIHSWLANQLLLLRDLIYPWIWMNIWNGKRCYYWSTNWSPFGKLVPYLSLDGPSRAGITTTTTLAELWSTRSWLLPAARSEEHVNVQSYLSSIELTDWMDSLEYWPNNKKIRLKLLKFIIF